MFIQELKIPTFNNWWALFILLPAIGSLSVAWQTYRSAGHLTRRVRSAVIVGIVLLLVTGIFLLNLNWTDLGPGLHALSGIALVIDPVLPE
jgi:hypothetical protein